MDFYRVRERVGKNKVVEIYPDFKVVRSKDLMVRGKGFYAVWDEDKGLWSTDEYDVQRLVDKELIEYRDQRGSTEDIDFQIKFMSEFSTNSWLNYKKFISNLSDSSHQLDESLTFLNTDVKKKDYVSRRLPYSLEEGPTDAYDELIGVLYSPEERAKLEWAVGAIVAGEAKDIQKFIVLYGSAGSGKSTFLNIVQKLFPGYYTTFEAKALTSTNNQFSTDPFRSNPLVAIQHDGDLSRIEDNTKLNSIISHEYMNMNEKYKSSYTARANCFLFMGTNKPVKITDAKAGIIRRLIDVRPTGQKVPVNRYHSLMARIDFELGAIAYKCLKIYWSMGKNYYSSYRPLEMMFQTDVFFNFVEANYDKFVELESVTLAQAYEMYKVYCDEGLIDFRLPKYKFREELKNYFSSFFEKTRIGEKQFRSLYSGFLKEKFTQVEKMEEEHAGWLVMDETISLFDEMGSSYPAQYASTKWETPGKAWSKVDTRLEDINTKRLHYVKVPTGHIVIDFDIKGVDGNKSLDKNLAAASLWPPTYSEYSKSGVGIHLHYNYEGDPSKLSSIYSEGIEVKVFNGDASLRRKLTKCNKISVNTINSGLPLKGEKVISFDVVQSEKGLRELVKRNLQKEIHPATKPSIDFIYKILEEAYGSGMKYDLSDLRPKILTFAMKSTHQSEYCVDLVSKMHFYSDEPSENHSESYSSDKLVFFDVEVYPNLVLVCWKVDGKENDVISLVNPGSSEIEPLLKMKLVGFNCRRYDNHILYAIYIGYSTKEIFELSQRIIGDSRNGLFGEAYNLSFADVYDFSSIKQSLKKFEIELGIHHQELGLPYDQDVSDENVSKVIDYCKNDVVATEAVFNNRQQDFVARQILADLSGLKVNDTTQMHTAKIIFGNDPKPQEKFIYTNLVDQFPGYQFENGRSIFHGEEVGEGGYVYAEPGFYKDVALLDVASMHPTSIEVLQLFGPYTKNFSEIKAARIAIKHKDFDAARTALNGCLGRYLDSDRAEDLAYALKIIIVSVYGFTSARFPSKFKDPRNIDNIVAKRGALFMIELKRAVQERGFTVAHIKTDSIKIPSPTKEIIDFVFDFGKKYGYDFEQEATFDRLCLVNDAVYVARYKDGKKASQWVAVGAQFAQPYVFKTLFSKEPIEFKDLCETKTVTTGLYLDLNEDLPDGEHNYVFIGKAGSFCPIKPGCGGGLLMREKEGKFYAATGSKGYRWLEGETITDANIVDKKYHENLVEEALETISKFVDPNELLS